MGDSGIDRLYWEILEKLEIQGSYLNLKIKFLSDSAIKALSCPTLLKGSCRRRIYNVVFGIPRGVVGGAPFERETARHRYHVLVLRNLMDRGLLTLLKPTEILVAQLALVDGCCLMLTKFCTEAKCGSWQRS